MCIYFGDAPNLTYNKSEHIFPVGLGGTVTLPQGWVSDQANELFSSMEGELMHDSLLALDRYFFGPGDRRGKDSKSNVTVGVQDDGKISLSYLSMGKPYLIDQVYLRAKNAVVSAQEDGSDADLIMKRVDKALRKFEARSRFVFLPCPDMAAEDLFIGAHDGKVFVACSSERPSGDRVYDAIRKILGGFQSGELKRDSQHIRQNHVLTENGNIARAYAKTGMNALARLRGYEYAAHPAFDGIRRWIVSGENDDEFNYLPSISVERNKLAYALPENVHFCVFMQMGGKIYALVSFCGRYTRQFTFGQAPAAEDFKYPDGYICDWKNKTEYTLAEHIERLIGNVRSKLETPY